MSRVLYYYCLMNKQKNKPGSIIQNRKAHFEYFIEDRFEAGVMLEGWEVKSLRAGKVNLSDSYVMLKRGEAWLMGCHISPLPTVSTHIAPDPTRSRKLLMHHHELNKLGKAVTRQGHTAVALAMYWKGHRVKVEVALAKGKQQHDKRAVTKQREWNKSKERLFKKG